MESAQPDRGQHPLAFAFLLHTIDSSQGQGALWPEGTPAPARGTGMPAALLAVGVGGDVVLHARCRPRVSATR